MMDIMGVMYMFLSNVPACRHLWPNDAERFVAGIEYTDRDGKECHGPHWTVEETNRLTQGMEFDSCVTEWDKYVALNAFYADLCQVLTDEQIVKAAYAFWFDDEDGPCDKVWRYVNSV